MGKKFDLSVVARFRDYASGKALAFARKLERGMSRGIGGGLARMFGGGGGRLAGRLASRPGGIGGVLSDLVSGAGGLVALPMRILGGFASLVPGVGGILSGVVGSAANILQGLVGVVANVVGGMVNAFGALVKGLVRVAEKAVGAVAGVLGKLAKVAGVAAAGAAAAFALLWRSVAKAGDAIAKMAKRTGLSVEFLSEMQHVAALNDASLQDMQTAIRGLGRAVEGAVRGAGEYVEVWDRLGVDLRERNGQLRETEDLFWEVLTALARVENRTLRMGMAQRMFGRSGERMLVLIDAGAKALNRQREEARRLGATWSGDYAKGAERAMDSMARLKTAWGGLKRAFFGPFLEPIARQFEDLAEWLATNRGQVDAWGKAASAQFERVAAAVRGKLGGAWQWLSTRDWSLGGLQAGLKAAGQALTEFVQMATGPAKDALVAAFEWIAAKVEGIFRNLWDVVLRDFRRGIGREMNKLGGALTGRASSIVKETLDAQAKKNYEKWRKNTLGFAAPWEEAPEFEKDIFRKGARLPFETKLLTDAMAAVGKAMGDVGLELHDKALSEAEKAGRAADIRAASDARAAQAADDLQMALNGLNQAVTSLKGNAAGAAQQTAPAQPEDGPPGGPGTVRGAAQPQPGDVGYAEWAERQGASAGGSQQPQQPQGASAQAPQRPQGRGLLSKARDVVRKADNARQEPQQIESQLGSYLDNVSTLLEQLFAQMQALERKVARNSQRIARLAKAKT